MRVLLWLAALLGGALACDAALEHEPPAPNEALAVEQPAAPEAPRVGAPNARPDLLEGLRADREAERHPGDGGGRAWLESDPEARPVNAQTPSRFRLVFEAGPVGIEPGGVLFFQVPPFWGWSTPQVEQPEAPGYTTVESDAASAELHAFTADHQLLAIEVAGDGLAAGEQVRIVYGAGPAGARVDRFAERGSRFGLAVDADGDGTRAFVADAPTVDIGPGPPARLALHLPAVARPGETVTLHAALLDAEGSTGTDAAFTLELVDAPSGVRVEPRHSVPATAGGRLSVPVEVTAPGVVRLRARGPDGLEGESNPMQVSATAPRILWADLHGHSNYSDGTGTPEDYFVYARDVAGLDAVALTDHDHWGIPFLDESPEMWSEIRSVTQRFHEPGRFVTMLGYEWTSWVYGHRHVLHFADDGPLASSVDEASDTPPELWAALRGLPALTFAHHSSGDPVATDWSIPPDPVLEPVTEIASVHGSSESADTPMPVRGSIPGNFVRDALGRGYRLGFVASGDSHDGHPGLAQLASPSGGVAAILSEERTREGVLAALRGRRTYGTNGPRILLWASLDGAPMGSALPPTPRHRLRVRVVSPGPLAAVELVADGVVTDRIPGEERRELAFESELEGSRAGGTLYVRVLQVDGGAAWSSPFFFE